MWKGQEGWKKARGESLELESEEKNSSDDEASGSEARSRKRGNDANGKDDTQPTKRPRQDHNDQTTAMTASPTALSSTNQSPTPSFPTHDTAITIPPTPAGGITHIHIHGIGNTININSGSGQQNIQFYKYGAHNEEHDNRRFLNLALFSSSVQGGGFAPPRTSIQSTTHASLRMRNDRQAYGRPPARTTPLPPPCQPRAGDVGDSPMRRGSGIGIERDVEYVVDSAIVRT